MIEESLLKSNFLGRDGFRWWIGQIPPGDSLGAQNKGGGWGNRFKVRILGYHPYSKEDLADEDLPWAGCLLPATSGTGASNFAESVKYRPGDVVVGFFMDGDNAQIPMIMGAFGRTSQVPQQAASGAFIPFTGYTSNISAPEGTLDPDESNEQNSESQKSPRSLSEEQTARINSSRNGEKPEIPASKADGKVISPANACDDNFIDEVSNILENFLGGIPKNPNGGIIGEAADFLGGSRETLEALGSGTQDLFTKEGAKAAARAAAPIAAQGTGDLAYATASKAMRDFEEAQAEELRQAGLSETEMMLARRNAITEAMTDALFEEEDINATLDELGLLDFAEGGIASLKDGGMLDFGGREMDLRGGGFVPIGKKEKADDVPARLSKNEFVMTADAVRAAGGGSVNKGAQRMYNLMNQLEARA